MSQNSLTCIKLNRAEINFAALVDGGSTVSAITESLLRKLKLTKAITYKNIKAKSWNDETCAFIGRVPFTFFIGTHKFSHTFYVAKKLATGTPVILGIDFLHLAEATLRYEPEGVSLTITKHRVKIPLIRASTKICHNNHLQIYTVKVENKSKTFMARNCKTIKLEPLVGNIVRLVLPTYNWPKQAHIEGGELKEGILFDPQIVTVHQYNPSVRAKHSSSCTKTQCMLACPTQKYNYALAFVYNSLTSPVYLHEGCKTMEVEPLQEFEKAKEVLNKAMRVAFANISKDLGEVIEDEKVVVNKGGCKSKKCVYHRDPDDNIPKVNYLNLDPIENANEYQKEYNVRHEPSISLPDRLKRVNGILDAEFPNIHQVARRLIQKYPEVVNIEGIPFVGCRTIKHKIIYNGSISYNKQYKTPNILESQILEEIDRLIREGLIEPSESPFSNCYLPVVKYDDKTNKYKIRLCLDLRKLNSGVEVDRLPIGNTQDLLNKLHEAKYLTVLDASSGYLQVDLEESSKKYTAFRVGNRCYVWKKMAFGLGSAPSTWARLMQLALSGVKNTYVYMDDIIVYANTLQEHEETLNEVFKRLSYHGIELSLKKCSFISSEVEYLGFLFTSEGLKPQERKLKTLMNIPLPTTLTEARSLISTFSFYRRFIRNFSKVAYPLIQLIKGHTGKGKSIKVMPNAECSEALGKLKWEMQQRVCLKYPDFSQPFVITTDASCKGLGAVLSQKDADGHLRPLAFASRTLSVSESRYPAVELECLGIIYALKTFRHIVLGYEINLMTDHLPLIYVFKNADPSSRLYRYQLFLLEYNIIGIQHIAGQDNVVCDYLSRWSFRNDEDLGPVISFASTSPLSLATSPKFKYEKRDKMMPIKNNSLIIFSGDARNSSYTQAKNPLDIDINMDQFYRGRVEISTGIPVSTQETSPELGQIIFASLNDSTYAMFITNFFVRPQINEKGRELMKSICNNNILQLENFKFKLRNDKQTLRDFYFLVCLERLLTEHDFNNTSEVQIFWPQANKETNNRITHVKYLLRQFSYVMWQKKIPCSVIGQPGLNFKGKDVDLASLNVLEAESAAIRHLPFEAIANAQKLDSVLLEKLKQDKSGSTVFVEGVAFKREINDFKGEILKVYVPKSMVANTIKSFHEEAHHPGFTKTFLDCQSQSYWEGMRRDVKNHVLRCTTCIQAKASNNSQVMDGHLVIPPRPGHTWAIDVLGSLPKSGYYNKILVMVCTLSRFTWVEPLSAGTASEVIKNLESLFYRYGTANVLVSDRAGAFTGYEFENYLTKKNIKHHLSTPYSPRSNALAERTIRSVLSILRVLCDDHPTKWSLYLPKVCEAINCAFHTSIGERPFFIFFGRDPRPTFNVLRNLASEFDTCENYQMCKYTYKLVSRELYNTQKVRDQKQDSSRRNTYDVGNIVYVKSRFVGDKAHKLRFPYEGPYRVSKVDGNTVCLKSLASGKSKLASMRDLKIYKGQFLTPSDNNNINRPYPIHQNIPGDEIPGLVRNTLPKPGPSYQRERYNLRSKKEL